MRLVSSPALFLLVTLLVAAPACSSSEPAPTGAASDAGTSADASTPPASDASVDGPTAKGNVTWIEDGAPRTANGSAEQLTSAAGPVGFAINAADTTALINISLNVAVTSAAEWKTGTFACPSPALLSYLVKGASYTMTTCTVTVTDVGAVGGSNLKGTFSATLTAAAGGATKTLSDGVIDIPYMKK